MIELFVEDTIGVSVDEHLPRHAILYQEKGPDPRNYRVDFGKIKNTLYFESGYSIDDRYNPRCGNQFAQVTTTKIFSVTMKLLTLNDRARAAAEGCAASNRPGC